MHMSKIKLMLAFAVSLFMFNSCAKDEAPEAPKCKVISLEGNFEDRIIGVATFQYDSQNRISRINSTHDSIIRSFTVVYTTNQVTLKTKYHGDFIYDLDSLGRTIKANTYRGNLLFSFRYNADGYVDQVTESHLPQYETTYSLSYTNGNLIRIIAITPAWQTKSTYALEYADEQREFDYTLAEPLTYTGIQDVIPGLFGKMSKGRLLKVTQDSEYATQPGLIYKRIVNSYSYVDDAAGNATNVTHQYSDYDNLMNNGEYYHNFTNTTQYKLAYSCNF